MDLWVVAAAAGAGYVAKNFQNMSVDKRESLDGQSVKYAYNVQSEPRNFLQQLRDKTCPLRRLERQRAQDNAFLDAKNHFDFNFSETDGLISSNRDADVASISGDDYSTGWMSSKSRGLNTEESVNSEDGGSRSFSRVNRGKLIRNRRFRGHSMRPLNSLGNCLEKKEHSTCLCPSMSTLGPLLVTDKRCHFDGSREEARRENGVSLKVTKTESFPSLKHFESVKELRKLNKSSDDLQLRSSCSQGPETMLLFITGMTVGILSATTSWKNEVDKLNRQLKHMENLVQDLHEELDMNEMLLVKELTDECDLPSGGKDTPLSIQKPISSPSNVKVDESNKSDSLKTNEKNTENLELLTRIEAELQAELEMLEKNMKASALERVSSVVELDPDFEPEIVQGDFEPTMVNDASELRNETTDTTPNCSKPANYAVSPRELSLRLHELIESELELRIKELEIALGNRQYQGSKNMVSGGRFSYSGTESSSTHQSPTCVCDEHDKREEEPYTEYFSSNYVDAYKDQAKEDGESGTKAVCKGKHSIDKTWNGEYDSISHDHAIVEEDRSVTLVQEMPHICDKRRLTSFMSNEDPMSEDEDSEESEMLLIRQIIERRKSGSSFNLKID